MPSGPGTVLAVLLGALLFAAGVAFGWWLAMRSARAAIGVAETSTREMAGVHREVLEKVFLMKGLHPHLAAPGTFVPEGVSRKDWDARQEPVEAEAVDNPEEEDEDRREFDRDMNLYFERLDKERASKTGG